MRSGLPTCVVLSFLTTTALVYHQGCKFQSSFENVMAADMTPSDCVWLQVALMAACAGEAEPSSLPTVSESASGG